MTQHPITKLLLKPNEFQTAYDFKNTLLIDLLTYGSAYLRVVRAGEIVRYLVPMCPRDLSVSSNAMGYPLYWHSAHGSMTSQDVIRIRDVAGHDVESRSRVLLSAERVGAMQAADRLIAETFASGVSMNYTVELAQRLDDESHKQLKDQLQAAFGQGAARRNSVAVIQGGKLSSIKGTTPADADLRELRAQLIDEIAAIFRVPASLVGGSGDQKYSNTTARLSGMYRDTFAPLIVNIEESLTAALLIGPEKRVKFDVGALVKGDLVSQITLASTAAGGAAFMTQNEARNFVGLDRIDNPEYDVLPESSAPAIVDSDPDARRGEQPTDNGDMGDIASADETD